MRLHFFALAEPHLAFSDLKENLETKVWEVRLAHNKNAHTGYLETSTSIIHPVPPFL